MNRFAAGTTVEERPDDLSAKVDALLALRRRDLKLPPEIMALYKERSRPSDIKMMTAWCIGVSLVNLVTGAFDYQPDHLLQDCACRLAVSLFFLLSVPALRMKMFRNREQYVIILPCLLMVALAGVLGRVTHDAIALDRQLSMTIVAVYTGVLFVRIEMRHLIVLGASSMCLAAAFVAGCRGNDIHDKLQLIMFYGCTMCAVLYARRVQDVYLYQVFLLRTREEIKAREALDRSERLSNWAYTDKLTEVRNRRYFDEICQSMSDTSKNLFPLALCMVDLDHFKGLNDSLGHLQGDRCLRVVAAAIKNTLRSESDILARFGGEEFILLLPRTSLSDARDVAERVREAIYNLRHPNPGSEARIVTASFGIAGTAGPPLRIEELIRQADAALYRAKAEGRNCVVSC